ncbi:MAG: glycosyltransferase [Saprospiraceae bacterium]
MLDAQLIVPCYNPREGWGDLLVERFSALRQALGATNLGLILVNDGTAAGLDKDQLQKVLSMDDVVFVQHKTNQGKGAAIRTGVANSTAGLILMTDIDLPYTEASMLSVWDTLNSHGGIVAGQRSSAYYVHVPLFRRLLSKTHRGLMRFVFRLPVSDSQAGLKGFDKAGKEIFMATEINRFLVDLEFLARSNKKVIVHPVPVNLRPGVVFTDFGLGILLSELGNFWRIMKGAWFGW